jgi:hypothetical protein
VLSHNVYLIEYHRCELSGVDFTDRRMTAQPSDNVRTLLDEPLSAYGYVRRNRLIGFGGTLVVIGGRVLPFLAGAAMVTAVRAIARVGASGRTVLQFVALMAMFWVIRRFERLGIPSRMRSLGRRLQRCNPGTRLARDRRRPVLFLRGFAADRDKDYAEAFFSELLDKFGPPIAIGDPHERLPKDGFYRLYVPNGVSWEPLFAELASASQLILIETSYSSEYLLWEVEQVFTSGLARRTVLLVSDQSSYEEFVSRVKSRVTTQFPSFEPRSNFDLFSFVLFTPEGTGCFRHVGDQAFFFMQIRQEIINAFQETGASVASAGPMASTSSVIAFLEFAGFAFGALGAYWFF